MKRAAKKTSSESDDVKTAPALDEISFEDACVEGKRLVEEMDATDSRVQWRLGELANLIEPEAGQPKYGDQTLAKFANRIGREPCTVKRYRTVFRAWMDILPKRAARPHVPYAVARELAGLTNRESLIEEHPTMTTRQATVLKKAYSDGKKPDNETERRLKDMLKRAGQALADDIRDLQGDRKTLLKVVDPSLAKTLRDAAKVWNQIADQLDKLFDKPANPAAFDGR